jgi:hypothetical protein
MNTKVIGNSRLGWPSGMIKANAILRCGAGTRKRQGRFCFLENSSYPFRPRKTLHQGATVVLRVLAVKKNVPKHSFRNGIRCAIAPGLKSSAECRSSSSGVGLDGLVRCKQDLVRKDDQAQFTPERATETLLSSTETERTIESELG